MMHLEQRCSLSLLVSTNLKVLAPLWKSLAVTENISTVEIKWYENHNKKKARMANLDWVLRHMFACLALQPQHNFLGCLCLLTKEKSISKFN
jgi:hypothetical protein